jgi:hypothetical protein
MEISIKFPQKIKNTPLLDTCPKQSKSPYYKDNCIPMFILALFTIARLWKQPRGPLVNEWIKEI